MENYSLVRTKAKIVITKTKNSEIMEISEFLMYRLKLEFFDNNETKMIVINDYGTFDTEIEIKEIDGFNVILVKPKFWKIDIDVFENSDFSITFNNKSILKYNKQNDEYKFYFDGLYI